jgi:hypothetical protein
MIDNDDDLRKTQKYMARVARGTHALRMERCNNVSPSFNSRGPNKRRTTDKDRNFPERY